MENKCCPSCGAEIYDNELARCYECGEVIPFEDTNKDQGVIQKLADRKEVINQVTLTTAPSLEDYNVVETIEIVTAECVFGINLFRDFFTGLTDFFGGRSDATQKVLRDARKICLYDLKKEAYRVDANAVIAVKLDYSEFSGKGKSMLFLVASGTAVKVEKASQSD